MNNKIMNFKKGLHAGIPICLGYLSVSFSFGIIASSYGLSCLEALFISMTNLTSAGQFAGLGIMAAHGSYIEMLIVEFTTNIRYAFMSISLSQKTDTNFTKPYRFLLGSTITDEIFAVSMLQKELNKEFYFGLSVLPYVGWSMGTFLGALLGNMLPGRITTALGVALYGMFIAIVVPVTKTDSKVLKVVLLGILLMCCFKYLPFLSGVSDGLSMTISAILVSLIGSFLWPVSNCDN